MQLKAALLYNMKKKKKTPKKGFIFVHDNKFMVINSYISLIQKLFTGNLSSQMCVCHGK